MGKTLIRIKIQTADLIVMGMFNSNAKKTSIFFILKFLLIFYVKNICKNLLITRKIIHTEWLDG